MCKSRKDVTTSDNSANNGSNNAGILALHSNAPTIETPLSTMQIVKPNKTNNTKLKFLRDGRKVDHIKHSKNCNCSTFYMG
jgi:hypothetical protein